MMHEPKTLERYPAGQLENPFHRQEFYCLDGTVKTFVTEVPDPSRFTGCGDAIDKADRLQREVRKGKHIKGLTA